jgi:dihydropyrimidinase
MSDFDLTIRNGTVVTAADTIRADIGVRDGRIVAIAETLAPGKRDIDATGRLVLPGGIDSHCHIEQRSSMGVMCADDYYSGTVSAAFGGNTTVLSFAAQHRGDSLLDVVADYSVRAAEKAVIDYGFHMIVSDATDKVVNEELPQIIRQGMTSFKVYMTYDMLKLDDYQILDVLNIADREGALVMVHAENHDVIRWIAERLIDRGHGAPKFHAVAHDPLAESEATHRAIQLSRVLDVPMLIVHVSGIEAVNAIRSAQTQGARILAETCPQYLFLTAADIDKPGLEGAKWCCSPPPRDETSQESVWNGLANGTFQVFSSDHAPYRFDESGKLPMGDKTTFKNMANGMPGLEVRLPLLFSEGVGKGRIGLNQFVALASTNAAKIYGIYPRKGTIAVGSDADIAIWNPDVEVTIRAENMHDRVGYSPYEGKVVKGWPETVVNRGRVVVADGKLCVERGTGQYLVRSTPEPVAQQRPGTAAMKTFKALIN